MSAIALDGVTIRLGGRTVLRRISLEIADHEFVGVLGPNGAGKTTLMRAILGLIPVAEGRITVHGHPVRRGNRLVGYMPQVRGITALRLSGRAFVAAAADGHRWGLPLLNASTRLAVDEALSMVGAEVLADRPVIELSGGERQRLLLAQSLLGRPRLLLLDEPLISLDPHRQGEVVRLVRRLQRELGIAVLFSAHELNPLLGALDRVLYLGGGRASLGTVDDVITAPVLSRLYGAPIEVMRLGGRIFVMPGGQEVGQEVEQDAHRHGSAGDHHQRPRDAPPARSGARR